MMHVPQGSSAPKETLKKCLLAMPDATQVRPESGTLIGGFSMTSYLFEAMYDRYPPICWSQYYDAPRAEQRFFEVMFRTICDAKQYGLHNMVKMAAINLVAIKQGVSRYYEEVRAYNEVLRTRHDFDVREARKDGQGVRVKHLLDHPPPYRSITAPTDRVLDEDFTPGYLNTIISEYGKSALINADGLTRQLGVPVCMIIPCDADDSGGYEVKLNGTMRELDVYTVGGRRCGMESSSKTAATYKAILLGITGQVDFDPKRMIIRTALPIDHEVSASTGQPNQRDGQALWANEWVPLQGMFAGITNLNPEGLQFSQKDLFTMAVSVNAIFKTIQHHALQSVVFPLLGVGKERWNLTILLWMISTHLPFCPNLISFRIVSRGTDGLREGNQNMVKRFVVYANTLINEAEQMRRSTIKSSFTDRMSLATGHFDRFRTELLVLHAKEPQAVLEQNQGTLSLIQTMMAQAESNGSTLFDVIYNSSPSRSLYAEEDQLLKAVTDRDLQGLDNARGKLWSSSNTISMTRLYEEKQKIVDQHGHVARSPDDEQGMYALPDMERVDFKKEIAVERDHVPFELPDDDDNAIVTLESKKMKIYKGQLVSKMWLFEWQKIGSNYVIHPSSIVFCSGKTKLQSMNKEEADNFMEGLGNWTQGMAENELPLVVDGPNLINPETNARRDFWNQHDAEAIVSG